MDISTYKTENLNNEKINKDLEQNIDVESLFDLFNKIEDKNLCISKSGNSLYTRVFVNETK